MYSLLIIILLIIISYEDFKKMEVSDFYFILMLLVILFNLNLDNLFMALIFTLIMLVFYYFKMLGGADLKLFFLAILHLGFTNFLYSLLISSILCLIYALISKKKIIPFIPFISIGMISVIIFL